MKRASLLLAAAMLMVSCGQRNTKNTAETQRDERAVVRIADSIRLQEAMGKVVENAYEGTLPAADTPGQRWLLTFFHQEYASHGVYELEQTFLEAENGEDRTFHSYGTWNIVTGNPHDIYVLTDYQAGEIASFKYMGEKLVMLDQDGNDIVSDHNYTLHRVAENARVGRSK